MVEVSSAVPQGIVAITVRLTASLTGRVLLSDGRPSVGTTVEASCYSHSAEAQTARTAITDDRGEFRVASILSDQCAVKAKINGRGLQRPTNQRNSDAFTMRRGATTDVGDLVIDIDGADSSRVDQTESQALIGRIVEQRTTSAVFPGIVSAEDQTHGVIRTAATDVSGHFVLDLPTGAHRVWASAPGYVTDHSGALLVRVTVQREHKQYTAQNVTLRLRRGGAIEGRVSLDNGEPLQGAVVHLYRERYVLGERRLVVEPQARSTDDGGAFRFFDLQPDSYYVSASFGVQEKGSREVGLLLQNEIAASFYPTGAATTAAPISISAESNIEDIAMTWSPVTMGTLAVQVFSAKGTVAPGVKVNVAPSLRSRLPMGIGTHATTDANGNVRFSGLADGQYCVHAYGENSDFGFAMVEVMATERVRSASRLDVEQKFSDG